MDFSARLPLHRPRPLATQHYPMLERNLLYTGVTRGKQLEVRTWSSTWNSLMPCKVRIFTRRPASAITWFDRWGYTNAYPRDGCVGSFLAFLNVFIVHIALPAAIWGRGRQNYSSSWRAMASAIAGFSLMESSELTYCTSLSLFGRIGQPWLWNR
jgi:hypothetical protein